MQQVSPRGGEPIDLARQYRKVPLARWAHPGDHPAFAGHLRIGRLADGRWFVDSSISEAVGWWAFVAEQDARAAVEEIRALRPDERWTELPPFDDPG